ncbi:hypothetical protein [Arthrobacter sp. NIO-1057]|uniref:hypothetical protein n=1 Tax=Arthrobacter sp. NIO-1057 TaxID=993071 RepID=UPI00071D8CB9|nr:hypothetical protein [Arthrobacter sp. NIO-1057]KSU67635.1 hypothetical protein AS038_00555 [Arthrobacter sp. NIO-1057]SCB74368.1 hypothetical protein GA0061084_0114 [Arthrobacter sp. NIO-1057]
MNESLLNLDEAARRLGVDTKSLRSYLRKHRPKGAVQKPPQPGGLWHVSDSLLFQLEIAGAPELKIVLRAIDESVLASLDWSPWLPFEQAAATAPVAPGVYMVRRTDQPDAAPIYIGAAGERSGKGLRGRLKIYSSGKGATSGFGKHAFDDALKDPQWLRQLAEEAEAGTPSTIQTVARRAIDRLDLEVRWVTCIHRKAALLIEDALIKQHHATVWNVVGVPQQSAD